MMHIPVKVKAVSFPGRSSSSPEECLLDEVDNDEEEGQGRSSMNATPLIDRINRVASDVLAARVIHDRPGRIQNAPTIEKMGAVRLAGDDVPCDAMIGAVEESRSRKIKRGEVVTWGDAISIDDNSRAFHDGHA